MSLDGYNYNMLSTSESSGLGPVESGTGWERLVNISPPMVPFRPVPSRGPVLTLYDPTTPHLAMQICLLFRRCEASPTFGRSHSTLIPRE